MLTMEQLEDFEFTTVMAARSNHKNVKRLIMRTIVDEGHVDITYLVTMKYDGSKWEEPLTFNTLSGAIYSFNQIII